MLAPQRDLSQGGDRFERRVASNREYARVLAMVQRFRGEIYLRDQAITAQDLDATGRHVTSADLTSWHLVWANHSGSIQGCARYRAYPNLKSFAELDVRHAALASDHLWGGPMRRAIRYQQIESHHSNRDFFEVSGWAIAETARFSSTAFTMAMAAYALGRVLGGGCGVTTATTRHCSSRILQRVGGRPLACGDQPLPPYFDPRFGCMMELLSFDTAQPNPRYAAFVESFEEQLTSTTVVQCAASHVPQLNSRPSVEFSGASVS